MKAYGIKHKVTNEELSIEIDYTTNSQTYYRLTTKFGHPPWIVPTKEIALDVIHKPVTLGNTEYIRPAHHYRSSNLEVVEYDLTPHINHR